MGRPRKNNLHLPARVYFSKGWHFYADDAGKWHKLGKLWDRAAKEQYATVSTGQAARDTVADMLDKFMLHLEAQVRAGKRASATLDGNYEEVVQLKIAFGALHYADVKRPHIKRYLNRRSYTPRPRRDANDPTKFIPQAPRLAPIRANREISLVSSAYSWAMGQDEYDIQENPCYGVRRNTETPKDRCPERWEIDAARAVSTPMWSLIFDLAYKIGQRGGDVRLLKKVTLQDDGIFITQSKTGERLLVEWDDELRDIVIRLQAWSDDILQANRYRAGRDTHYLIVTRFCEAYSAAGWKAMVYKFVRAAIADPDNPLQEPFSFHDIRAKTGTDVHDAGGDAQRILGHKTRSQTDDYIRSKKVHRVKALPLKRAS